MQIALSTLAAALALAGCSQRNASEPQAGAPGETGAPQESATASAPSEDTGDGQLTPRPGPYSTYTTLDLDKCDLVDKVEEGASAKWSCPGYGGFRLIALTGDGRMDLDAGSDNGSFESLSPFNDIGNTVEWRLRPDDTPFAIIYRLRTATPEVKPRSVLFVETVPDPGKPGCLIARIGGAVTDANRRARELADGAMDSTDCARLKPVLIGETG